MSGEPFDLHHKILTEAEELFIRFGYHGLSMRQIAEQVGVSKAALYYHFQDKESLFLAMLETNLEQVTEVIRQSTAAEQNSRAQIHALIKGILSLPTGQRAVIRLASQEMPSLSQPARKAFYQKYEQKFIAQIADIIARGSARGELRPLDPFFAAWTLLGMMYPYFYPSSSGESPLPAHISDAIAKLFLEGVAAPDADQAA